MSAEFEVRELKNLFDFKSDLTEDNKKLSISTNSRDISKKNQNCSHSCETNHYGKIAYNFPETGKSIGRLLHKIEPNIPFVNKSIYNRENYFLKFKIFSLPNYKDNY